MGSSKQSITFRASPAKPCPVCGHGSKGCSVTADELHLCRGEPNDPSAWTDVTKGRPDAAGFLHFRRSELQRRSSRDQASSKGKDWGKVAARLAEALTAVRRSNLARALRLPIEAFSALPLIGWKADERCWTLPECDAAGTIVGLNRRFGGGKKKVMQGGHRGLTVPQEWQERSGPVFIVEGASDTLAMTHAGLCCIGRPSNSGGVDLLARLLGRWPADRDIVVLGENDQKPNGDWPGKDGAMTVARGLTTALGRRVSVALPPSESKDARDWLTAAERGQTSWAKRGDELSAVLLAVVETFNPPAPVSPPVRVPDYSPFPVDALPSVLREYVVEVAGSVGCDPAFAALPALTVAGAAVGAALVVRVKRGYEEPPLLWLLTVGDSGTGKSPAFKPSANQAFAIDKRLKAAYRKLLTQYEVKLKEWEASKDKDPMDKPTKPVQERFAVVDATIERLTIEAANSPRGLIVVRDEADGWLGSFTQYKGKTGGTDMPNWLSMFDAGPVRYMRRTGDPREVEADRAFVAVCGGIQPDILKATLSNSAFISSGLTARMGFAMPPKVCPKWSERELSATTEQALADVLDSLRTLPFDPERGPGRVNLDVVAKSRFKRLNNEFAETAESLDGGPMAAVMPKAVRFALRLALVWWCVTEAAAGRDPSAGSLTDEAMAAGEELARWFVHEAGRVYAMLAERPEDRSARTLAEWVSRKGGRVRPRDLQRSHQAKYPTAEVAEAALDALASAGFGEWVDDPPKAGGGRPGRMFVAAHNLTPDTRRNPTQHPLDELSATDVPPDTTTERRSETGRIPARSEVVSGFVGCRVEPDTSPSTDADGEVVSATPHRRKSSTTADDSSPVWADNEQFFSLMSSRGWTWPQVLAWLKVSPNAGFFRVPIHERRRAAEHLERLPKVKPTVRK